MFCLGILSGLLSSIIYGVLAWQYSIFRKVIPTNLRKSLSWEFRDQKDAEKSIIRDIKNTKTMRVFTLKCSTFCDEYAKDDTLFKVLHNSKLNIKEKYLISSVDNPYIAERERNLKLKKNDLKRGIEQTISHVRDEKNLYNSSVDYRLHNEKVRFRLIIFDDNLYLSYQPEGAVSRESPMQKYPQKSSGYSALEAYFEDLWSEYSKKQKKVSL